jgi:hypothetical protein
MSVPRPASEASPNRQLAFRRHEGVAPTAAGIALASERATTAVPTYRGHHPQFA